MWLAVLIFSYLQLRRPTLVGWSLLLTSVVVGTYFFGVSDAWNRWEVRSFALLMGVTIAVLLFLFRPQLSTGRQALILALICVVLGGALSALELYREDLTRPLGHRPMVFFECELPLNQRIGYFKGDFKVITRMNKLPTVVQGAFREKYGRLLLADPGKRFEETDFITDESIPRMRLIFAGTSKNFTFVHYESGGFAPSYRLEVFATGGDAMWMALCDQPAADLNQLRNMVETNKCHCRYSH